MAHHANRDGTQPRLRSLEYAELRASGMHHHEHPLCEILDLARRNAVSADESVDELEMLRVEPRKRELLGPRGSRGLERGISPEHHALL